MVFLINFLIPIAIIFLGLFFFIPTLIGSIFTALSAFGWDFFQSCYNCWGEAFSELFLHPQFLPSLTLTLRTTLLSTGLSMMLVFIIAGGWSRRINNFVRFIPLWLSYPHVAFSTGLMFLISPSGLLVRWLGAPFDIEIPLDWETYQDSFGLALILGLTFKETIFLLFMAFSQISQTKVGLNYQVAASLGYSPAGIWLKIIWPQVYRGIRFPFFIVLSYSFSAVDISLILAGNTPPPFAILILNWFQDPDLSYSRISSAGTLILILTYSMTVGGWWIGEKIVKILIKRLIYLGSRKTFYFLEIVIKNKVATILFNTLSFILLLSLIINGIWSISRSWPFPKILPTHFTWQTWNMWDQNFLGILGNTLSLATVSSFMAMVLVVIVLEIKFTRFTILSPLNYLPLRFSIFLPLLLPTVFLFISIRIFFLTVFPLPIWITTVIGHFLLTFPYTLLTLEKTYHHFNQQYFIVAQTLSRSTFKSYFYIKFLMLKKPLLTSLAIALSVSMMDYLATTILSGGLIPTITTEAVQLSEGKHYRVMGFFAIIQTLLLSLVFFSCFSSKPNEL